MSDCPHHQALFLASLILAPAFIGLAVFLLRSPRLRPLLLAFLLVSFPLTACADCQSSPTALHLCCLMPPLESGPLISPTPTLLVEILSPPVALRYAAPRALGRRTIRPPPGNPALPAPF